MKKSSSFSFSQVASVAAATTSSSKSIKKPITKHNSYHQDKKGASCINDKSYEKWEKFREMKLDSMKAHKQHIERRLKSGEYSIRKYNHHETIQPPNIPKPRNARHQRQIQAHLHEQQQQQQKQQQQQQQQQRLQQTSQSQHQPRRKKSLDPNWYTENIYTNQSHTDSDCDNSHAKRLTSSASFSHYNTASSGSNRYNHMKNKFHRHDFNGNNKSNSININISNTANTKLHGQQQQQQHHQSSFDDESFDVNSPYFERHRNYPKSHSCSFAGMGNNNRESDTEFIPDARAHSVPKSHSFSTSRSLQRPGYYDMDLIEYQRYKRMMNQRYRDRGPVPDDEEFVMRICDREGCFSETCLVKNVNNSQNISINNNIINNNNLNTTRIINDWDLRNKNCNYRDRNINGNRSFPRDTLIDDTDTFDDDDFIFNDGFSFQDFPCQPIRNRQRNYRRPNLSTVRYNEFSDHFYRRNRIYDRELDDLFRHERSKVLIRGKFDKLNKFSEEFVDDYQKSFEDIFNPNQYHGHSHNLKPTIAMNKTMLEVKAPNKYDDTESDSTDLDLDDFNFDFEKYWEELEDKQLSTSSTLELEMNEQMDHFDSNNNPIHLKNINLEHEDILESPPSDVPIIHSHHHHKRGFFRRGNRHKVYPEDDINVINDSNNNPINLLNNIFSKSSKYSPLNYHSKQRDYFMKILPPKKMNIPSTARPLGIATIPTHDDYIASLKRPLTLNNIIESPMQTSPITDNPYYHTDEQLDQPKFQIIPNKTGLKISPLYQLDDLYNYNINNINSNNFYDNCNNLINKSKNKLKSTARPLLFW